MVDVGQLVNFYRKGKKMSQKELMEKSGISANTICDLENNKISPTVRTMEALAEGLGMELVVTFVNKR